MGASTRVPRLVKAFRRPPYGSAEGWGSGNDNPDDTGQFRLTNMLDRRYAITDHNQFRLDNVSEFQ